VIAYFDASALAALYLADDCTAKAIDLWEKSDRIVSSTLTYAETLAAFKAAFDDGEMSVGTFDAQTRRFKDEWKCVAPMPLTKPIFPEISRITRFHRLKGADVVQLASARTLQRRLMDEGEMFWFGCDDAALARAGRADGLNLAW
jgi:predicted nucleic acid-binding protein